MLKKWRPSSWTKGDCVKLRTSLAAVREQLGSDFLFSDDQRRRLLDSPRLIVEGVRMDANGNDLIKLVTPEQQYAGTWRSEELRRI